MCVCSCAHAQLYTCYITHLEVRNQHFESQFPSPTLFGDKVCLFCLAIELHIYFYTILLYPSFLSASGVCTGNPNAHNCIYLVM